MAPLKFEDKIREKLQQRTITPSQDSWSKLASELDKKKGQKEGFKRIWLYGVAAGLVGFLIIASLFYNNKAETSQDLIVDTKKITDKEGQKIDWVSKEFQEPEEKIEKKELIDPKSENKTEIVNTDFPKKYKNEVENQNRIMTKEKDILNLKDQLEKKNKSTIAEVEKTSSLIKAKETPLINNNEIEEKITGIVAQVEEMKKNNIEVTEEEINNLLQQAQQEITSQRIIKSNKISATALLQDVEEELDETFKERVFEALKTGFKKVRTAVAERNQ